MPFAERTFCSQNLKLAIAQQEFSQKTKELQETKARAQKDLADLNAMLGR